MTEVPLGRIVRFQGDQVANIIVKGCLAVGLFGDGNENDDMQVSVGLKLVGRDGEEIIVKDKDGNAPMMVAEVQVTGRKPRPPEEEPEEKKEERDDEGDTGSME